ncbi:RND family efflux transporter, MFP subunit [Litoreibacter ascidiaceicola]|uniref:RND family efflux transporter, MFP subunit n=1 Tax=Litoreibacter ascidiaceicola TaxID=1486859 RepID=A0A1M5CB27_9RHOB|nr:HlyD family efflux transporter periplasmic adaptor subunit [Litoreibacter ascidiaceicola]SHF51900.1 RND family efflux transporter, MFP subunit [Litoreibacter ascidiaceicola]
MRFFRRSLVGLFLMALTVGLLAVGGNTIYSSLQERWAREGVTRPARERVFSVNVVALEPATVTPVLTSFGEVRSRRTLDLRAPVGGTVVELSPDFQEGGTVRKGQLLARIDPADAQTAVDVSRTDLVEAEADLREARNALALAQDDLAAAQEQLALRARALQRQRDLKTRGVGTEATVETAELAEASAKQSVLSRRQAIQQAEARVSQTQTLIERRRINLTNAERLLADTEVFAAFDGRLSGVTATEGGLVANNEQLAELIDPDDLEVSFRVSTAQYARLLDSEGKLTVAPVTVTLDVLGTDLSFQGRMTRESAAVSEGTTGRLLFAELTDTGGLRPGDFVTVAIEEPALERVAVVPSAAVDAAGTVLVLGDEDRLENAEVTVLRRQGDDVLVRARGLQGREIVAERSQLLGAGIKVKPLRGDRAAPEEPEMVELDQDRRAKLIAFVEANTRIPDEVKTRMLVRLAEPQVPADMIERLESRMGS